MSATRHTPMITRQGTTQRYLISISETLKGMLLLNLLWWWLGITKRTLTPFLNGGGVVCCCWGSRPITKISCTDPMTSHSLARRQYHFAGFKNRLPMPKVDTATSALAPFYYSFDYGPVHFVVYSSEHPFSKGSEQWDFINRDLQAASAPAARAARPWIVVWSHRPLYCSDLMTWEDRCLHEATEYRANIEAMLLAAKVDLHISGHNHQYERSWPVSGCNKDYQGCTVTKSYHNPTQPVHIVNGAGGDVEGIDNSWIKDDTKVPFRAFNDIGHVSHSLSLPPSPPSRSFFKFFKKYFQ